MRVFSFRLGSPILAATAALAILGVLPGSAAAWSAPNTLASPGTYWANGVATEGDNVVVPWLENASHLVYRTSTDRGKTFNPPVDLGTANPGAVTLCDDTVVGIRLDTSAGTVKLDRRVVAGNQSSYIISTLASGRNLTLTGMGVVCVDGRRIATYWDEYVGGELHLKVAVVAVHLALQAYEFDLGLAPIYRIRAITATRTGIWVAWSTDSAVIVQRLDVGTGAQMRVKMGPRYEVDSGCSAESVGIAAAGRRVYLAYECPGTALMRISHDRGVTFGKERILYQSATDPLSVYGLAARQNVVAASIHVGPWCGGCVGSNRAVYSTDWGRTWAAEGPTNTGGYMPGVALLGSGPSMRIVQAWDNRTSHETYGDPGFIKFRKGP